MSTDFTLARNNMVDSQIRPVRVSDPRLLEAMRTVPREHFLPPAQREFAYVDVPIDLGHQRQLMEPRVLARLLQLAAPRRGERVLIIGAGTGYSAALLAALGLRVTGLEEDERLLPIARAALADTETSLRQGAMADGLPGEPPFDLVLLEGAVEIIPPSVERSVAKHGRLVTVLLRGATGQGVLAEHSGTGLATRPHFDASAHLLPGFGKPTGFRF